jgi:hypothetical protein
VALPAAVPAARRRLLAAADPHLAHAPPPQQLPSSRPAASLGPNLQQHVRASRSAGAALATPPPAPLQGGRGGQQRSKITADEDRIVAGPSTQLADAGPLLPGTEGLVAANHRQQESAANTTCAASALTQTGPPERGVPALEPGGPSLQPQNSRQPRPARVLLQAATAAASEAVLDGRRVLVITFPAPAFLTTTVLLYMAPGADLEVDAVMLGGYLGGNSTGSSGSSQDTTPPVIYLNGSAEVTVDLYSTYADAGGCLARILNAGLSCANKVANTCISAASHL